MRHAVSLLDGEMAPKDYNSAIAEDTAGLSPAAALLTEGLGVPER